MKIGIDIDNVLAESYPAYLSRFNREFKANISIEEITDFYFLNKYVHRKYQAKQAVNYIDELVLNEEFQLNIPPVSEAIKVIKYWLNKGYKIHYVTARPPAVGKMTLNWLKKHGFWEKGSKLDLFNEDNHFSDVDYKREIADKYKLQVFIEDHLEIARRMKIPVFLFNRPWNQGKLQKNIIRVYSWEEIEEELPKVLKSVDGKN